MLIVVVIMVMIVVMFLMQDSGLCDSRRCGPCLVVADCNRCSNSPGYIYQAVSSDRKLPNSTRVGRARRATERESSDRCRGGRLREYSWQGDQSAGYLFNNLVQSGFSRF
jgi:hypothetical protein